jgi:hypothetical protein
VHHYTIQINHQLDATVSLIYYPDVYLQLNMFRASSLLHLVGDLFELPGKTCNHKLEFQLNHSIALSATIRTQDIRTLFENTSPV